MKKPKRIKKTKIRATDLNTAPIDPDSLLMRRNLLLRNPLLKHPQLSLQKLYECAIPLGHKVGLKAWGNKAQESVHS